MHILQINTEKGWRGGERQTLLSMQGLRDAGVAVTLLCLRNQPLCDKATDAGFPVVAVANQFGAFWHCAVHHQNYALMHAQSSRAFGFAALAKLLTAKPLIYTRRAEFVPHGVLAKLKYRQASAIVAISNAIGTVLHAANLGNAEIISSIVIPPQRNEARITNLKTSYSLDCKRIVGIVAALTREKGTLDSINAAAAVVNKLPDVVFVHFGSGDLLDAATAEIAQLTLQRQYLLMGFQDRVEELFGMFDLFVMSSLQEGLGSSILDAFAAGVPVAATSAGGMTELVDGRGLLSPKGDPEALAENIVHLLTNSQLASSLAEKAKDYVFRKHGAPVIISKYLELYKTVIGKARP